MLPDVEFEALCCLDRPTLEGLQIHSRHLRNLVNHHHHRFPLRYIEEVMIWYDSVDIRLIYDDDLAISVKAPRKQDLEMLFNRFNNAFIDQLVLRLRSENLPLLHYLRANAAGLQCKVRVLHLHEADAQIDYDLVSFIGAHLKPHTYKLSTSPHKKDLVHEYAVLFAHDALRGTVAHLEYEYDQHHNPKCIVPKLFGVDVVKTCDIVTGRDPRPWIGKFIEAFSSAEPGKNIVRSVTLLHQYYGDVPPSHPFVDPLGQPRRTAVPTPHSDFIEEWLLNAAAQPHEGIFTESAVADVYVFENATAAKKLEVFLWPIVQSEALSPYPGPSTFTHYVFRLQVADM